MLIAIIKMIHEMENQDEPLPVIDNAENDVEAQELLEEFFVFKSRYSSELLEKCKNIVVEAQKYLTGEDWVFYMEVVMEELKEKEKRGDCN